MLQDAIRAGFTSIACRPGLAVLLYAVGGLLAFVLSTLVYNVLADVVGPTGFGPDLTRDFDVVLWADVLEEAGTTLGTVALQLLWIGPLYLPWTVAASVGLIHALKGSRTGPFWQGVGRYTGRALLLALLYGLLAMGVFLPLAGLIALLDGVWDGEVAAFWTYGVAAPTLLITALSILDLMQDYSRIALVVEEPGVWRAWKAGVLWPFRHGMASRLYVVWFALAAVLLVLPTLLDMSLTAATTGTIWLLFGLQQLALLARAAVTVGWIGSEVAFFEDVRRRQVPPAAEDAPPAGLDVERCRPPSETTSATAS